MIFETDSVKRNGRREWRSHPARGRVYICPLRSRRNQLAAWPSRSISIDRD